MSDEFYSLNNTISVTPNKWLGTQSGINTNWRHKFSFERQQSATTSDNGLGSLIVEGQIPAEQERRTSRQTGEVVGGFHDSAVATRKPLPNNNYREQVRVKQSCTRVFGHAQTHHC